MIATVLRSGGEYLPEHVQRLAQQCAVHAPGVTFVCLSDVTVPGVQTVPLVHGWPGWWSKIELLRPDAFTAGARVLYMDLDTTIVGDLGDALARSEPCLALRDFTRPSGIGSGLMQWTAGEHGDVYGRFAADPTRVQLACGRFGDQRFIGEQIPHATRWQDVLPGQVVSFKQHCSRGVPEAARIVCYHGHPRPWAVAPLQRVA